MPYTAGLPLVFAETYLVRNVARDRGEFGDALRRFLRSPAVTYGAPASVYIGFASGATRYEDTGTLSGGSVPNPRFKETSFLGTESGPTFVGPRAGDCARGRMPVPVTGSPYAWCTFGPSPNPDPSLPFSNYARWATHPYIRRSDMLGRDASLRPGACFDVVEGTAVGLLNLRGHQGQVNAMLPAELRANRPGSLWGVMLAFNGWSTGMAGAAASILPFRAALASADEDSKPGVWLWSIARAAATRSLPGSAAAGVHGNIGFDAARVIQKVIGGRTVELSRDGALRDEAARRWYSLGMSPVQEAAVFDVIARRAYGASVPQGIDLGPMPRVVRPAGDPPGPVQIVEILPDPTTPYAAADVGFEKTRPPQTADALALDWTDLKTVEDVLPPAYVDLMATYGLHGQKSLWRGWEAVLYGEAPR